MTRAPRKRVSRRKLRHPQEAQALITAMHMVLDNLGFPQQVLHRASETVLTMLREESPRVVLERFAQTEAYIDAAEISLAHLRRSVRALRKVAMQ